MNDRFVSGVDAETRWSRPMAKLMVESIRVARGKGPDSWAAYAINVEGRVNVGKRTIGVVGPRTLNLLISSYILTPEERKEAERYIYPQRTPDKTYSGIIMLRFTHESAEEAVQQFRDSHLSAVRRLSEQNTSQLEKRDERIVVEIERIAGV